MAKSSFLDFNRKFLQILVIFKISIHCLPDDFGAFFPVFLSPFCVFNFDRLIFLFLVESVRFMLKSKDS
jgi:hypothetical protein